MNRELAKQVLVKFSGIISRTPFLNRCKFGNIRYSNEGKVLFRCTVKSKGQNNQIYMGHGGALRHTSIVICGDNNIVEIGADVSCINTSIYIEDNNNTISIGEKTSICGTTNLSCIEGTKIVIGNDCLLSSDIQLRTGDSHVVLDKDGNRINEPNDIVIGNHVWIGNGVKILKGTKISNDSVVGTGSILTKCFTEPNVLIVGNPAQIKKREIHWERERKA